MADSVLNIVVQAKDESSGIFSGIEEHAKGLGSTLSDVGKLASGFLAANVIGAGFGALSGFLKDGISDAREANIIFAQSEQVIKSTGGAAGVSAQQVADYATSLSAASGKSLFGDDQIAQSENLLLTFTNIKGKALEAATSMTVDMAQAMGGAPKDAAIQLGKALNDPMHGITALTRVGVTFDEQQKKQIATMQKHGDVAGAQGIILKELSKEFGGSAEAAAKADGGMAQFKDRMGELGESIGHQLEPITQRFFGFMAGPGAAAIESIAGTLADRLGSAITWVSGTGIPRLQAGWAALQGPLQIARDAVTTFAQALSGQWTDSTKIQGLHRVIGELGTFLHTTVVPAVTAAVTAFQSWYAGMGGGAGIISKVSGAVVEFATGVQNAVKWVHDHTAVQAILVGGLAALATGYGVSTAAAIANSVATGAGTLATTLMTAAQTALNFVLEANPIGIVVTALAGLAAGLVYAYQHSETFRAAVDTAWASLKAFGANVVATAEGLANAWVRDWDTITHAVDKGVADIVVFFATLPGKIGALAGQFTASALAIGSSIVAGIQNGISGAWASFTGWIHSKIMEIPEAIRKVLGIKSPSQVMAETVGQPIVEGIQLGVFNAMPNLLATMRQSGDDTIKELVSFIDSGDTKSTLSKAGADALNQLIQGFTGTTSTTTTSPARQVGSGFVTDIAAGMQAGLPNLQDQSNAVAGAMFGGVAALLGGGAGASSGGGFGGGSFGSGTGASSGGGFGGQLLGLGPGAVIGGGFVNSMIQGIFVGQDPLLGAAVRVATYARDGAGNTIDDKHGQAIGGGFVDGITGGINGALPALQSAADRVNAILKNMAGASGPPPSLTSPAPPTPNPFPNISAPPGGGRDENPFANVNISAPAGGGRDTGTTINNYHYSPHYTSAPAPGTDLYIMQALGGAA